MKKRRIGSRSVVVRLAAANMKRKKGELITLTLFIFLAAMFLNFAFVILTQSGDFYKDAEERTHGPHFDVLIQKNLYRDEYEDFLKEDERISEYGKEEVLYMESAESHPSDMSLEVQLADLGAERNVGKFCMTKGYSLEECEAHGFSAEEAIYLPLTMEGYTKGPGSLFEIVYEGKKYEFKVAGFYDAVYYQNPATASTVRYYISSKCFEKLKSEMNTAYLLMARFKDMQNVVEISENFKNDFLENTRIETTIQGLRYGIFSWDDREVAVYSMMNIGVAIFLLAAVLFLVIVLIVMVNSIRESIEDGYQSIGILEAMGYRSGQIAGSYLLKYGAMAAVSSLAGSLASILFCNLAASPFLTKVGGLLCYTHTDILLAFGSAGIIMGVCILFVMFPLRKIRSCTILTALRKGKETHDFGKNVFPLYKGKGSVHTRLALKNVWVGRRQNILLAITIFFCMTAFGMFLSLYETFADGDNLMNMGGFELSDMQLTLADGVDAGEFSKEIEALPQIRKANPSCTQQIRIDGQPTMTVISGDFSKMETLKVTQGESVCYENEIVLSEKLCNLLKKEIGDSVTAAIGGQELTCYITGTLPVSTNSGLAALLGETSMKLLQSDYKMNRIDLYFEKGVTKAEVIDVLSEKYKIADQESIEKTLGKEKAADDVRQTGGKYNETVQKAQEKIETLLDAYGMSDISYSVMLDGEIILKGDSSAYKINQVDDMESKLKDQLQYLSELLYMVVLIFVVISMILVAGILSMIIRVRIRKNREEYGIYKSLGYTTFELMKQNALSFSVSAAVGGIAGIAVTWLTAGQVLQLFFVTVLGSRIQVKFDNVYLIGSGILLILFVFGFAMLKSWKIRKISAYGLITE